MFLASSSDRRGVQGVRISTASFWNSAPLEIEGFAQVLRQAAVGLPANFKQLDRLPVHALSASSCFV